MIQIITYETGEYNNYPKNTYVISKLGEIQAFDDFEFCVIDLTSESIWIYDGANPNSVNCKNDLLTIKEAILNRKTAKILILFPQNIEFNYNWMFDGGQGRYLYKKTAQLKDIRRYFIDIFYTYLYDTDEFEISFEKTKTLLGEKNVYADFNFKEISDTYKVITSSQNSQKATTIQKDNVYITTLDLLKDNKALSDFISTYCLENNMKEEVPAWVQSIRFYNDELLERDKDSNNLKIQELKEKNRELQEQLEKNMEYKSILYSTGDELVKVVLEMLDEILEYDSSQFIDEKKEDFLIKKEDVTFVGEIKGLSSAVQNKNLSQLEVHTQNYFDILEEEGKEENVKGLLVINHQRNKPLEERQEIHEHQKNLAEKYGSLIIETPTLLKIYEKYKRGDITTEECKALFKGNSGILRV